MNQVHRAHQVRKVHVVPEAMQVVQEDRVLKDHADLMVSTANQDLVVPPAMKDQEGQKDLVVWQDLKDHQARVAQTEDQAKQDLRDLLDPPGQTAQMDQKETMARRVQPGQMDLKDLKDQPDPTERTVPTAQKAQLDLKGLMVHQDRLAQLDQRDHRVRWDLKDRVARMANKVRRVTTESKVPREMKEIRESRATNVTMAMTGERSRVDMLNRHLIRRFRATTSTTEDTQEDAHADIVDTVGRRPATATATTEIVLPVSC